MVSESLFMCQRVLDGMILIMSCIRWHEDLRLRFAWATHDQMPAVSGPQLTET